ncbi:hypothetical protein RGU72_05070 [Undibacterium sp. 5I1]|uniref:hypothetical protein n=1 Tax=unclassified Undibacterium TaxID=2630295 RepID=UPI002AB355AE|nr:MULTISPECIES: hypothetical protein [unclassified Undibacterium]MDY7537625.1 hypothetical protein [Undibacterium sp. 5I1]MEB0230170.1 hypothetical protein [Undibacterium sp. 10I3]MEB0256362.1 hypothetical protein [Undibacterium sp. 5I1]
MSGALDYVNNLAIKNSGLPIGAQVTMAGTNSSVFTAPSGEVFVKNSIAAVIPASQCNSLLPALMNAVNDITFPTTIKVDLTTFGSSVSGIPSLFSASRAVGGTTTLVPSIGVYANSTYYLFSPNVANLGSNIGYTSTTDQAFFTAKKSIPQLAGLTIVDVKFVNGVWYFIDSSGYIASMTDLSGSNFTIIQTVMMPNAASYGYTGAAYINGVWYLYGSSRTGYSAGSIIVRSTDMVTWTIISEVTSGSAPITSLCQGSGTTTTTEIIAGCLGGDYIFKSVNNGTTFTQVSAFSGKSYIRSVFYSTRTSKYYAVAADTNLNLYLLTSSTGTLATATFTSLLIGAISDYGSPGYGIATIVDTGTNVGIVYSNGSAVFGYNNAGSAANVTITNDLNTGVVSGSYLSCLALTMNGNIWVLVCQSGSITASQMSGKQLILVSGPTLATASKMLWFPTTQANFTPPAAISGVQYSVVTGLSYDSANNFSNLYKFGTNFASIALASNTVLSQNYSGYVFTGIGSMFAAPSLLQPGVLTWTGINNVSNNVVTTLKYDGTTFSASQLNGAAPYPAGNAQLADSSDVGCTAFAAKWSSLFSAYLYSGSISTTGSSAAMTVLKAATLGGASSNVYTLGETNSSYHGWMYFLDVLSGGQGIMGYTQNTGNGPYAGLTILTPTANYLIPLSGIPSINTCYLSAYDITGTDGNRYLAVVYALTGGGTPTNGQFLSVFRIFTNSAPVCVLNTSIAGYLGFNTSSKMRRVVATGNNFYLCDFTSGTSTKNALLLTQSGGAFSFAGAAYCNLPTDNVPSGVAGITGSFNSATVAATSATAAVYLPPATSGNYVKVK